MNLYELAACVIEALDAEGIPYMVVGALSSSVFGIPRATKDVIVQKLRWGRAKDLEDARDVLVVQTPAKLDMDYITRWCGIHQTSGRLHLMLAEIEPLL